ncbi:MAG: hypothetical protein HOV68_15625 [Streptomycetaceae bacterium]|nr:hypothetical protein [Streptomycetaceae bacterium]
MSSTPTSLLNALFALTDDPASIRYEESGGCAFITLGSLGLSLDFTSQEALDKFAVVAAQAAAANRAAVLKAVS